jgi:SAM-dependent methyltransferase
MAMLFLRLVWIALTSVVIHGFTSTNPSASHSKLTCLAATGFGAPSNTAGNKLKVKKNTIKQTQERILKKYGSDIGKGTQKLIDNAMDDLPPHLRIATQLYQQLQKWNAHFSTLSVLEQTRIPQQDMEGARRAQAELEKIYKEHDLTENDLHNVFQIITWDASADAKAARAITGKMPKEIVEKVDQACVVVADAVKKAGTKGRCLDVGCGFGVLVPHLTGAGISPSQIHGVDLSSEMIKNAREQHRGVTFEAADFLNDFHDEIGFDAVIFCSALHDFPDPVAALQKAASLLRFQGKLVVAHPMGASHVERQLRMNPVMVRRGLPDAEELKIINLAGLKLIVEPNQAEGYLAVLEKR